MENRKLDSLYRKIVHITQENIEQVDPSSICVMTSPSDIGIRRNGGRNGARFAPASILQALSKLNDHSSANLLTVFEVTNQIIEIKNFKHAQEHQAELISKILKKNTSPIKIHLGGGHDHIFSLLKGIKNSGLYDKIIILNLDAHCDTRTDNEPHSGTPFRNFDIEAVQNTHLFQYGIHPFSNSQSTLSPLKNIKQEIHFYCALKKETKNFQDLPMTLLCNLKDHFFEKNNSLKTAFVFSLDCDAIRAEQMAAVSAPNPQGLPLEHIQDLLHELNGQMKSDKNTDFFLGTYELNPVFDQTSAIAAKRMATLIWSLL